MESTIVRRVTCALCDERELFADPSEEALAKRGWMRIRQEWWCRACASLARASALAARAIEKAS